MEEPSKEDTESSLSHSSLGVMVRIQRPSSLPSILGPSQILTSSLVNSSAAFSPCLDNSQTIVCRWRVSRLNISTHPECTATFKERMTRVVIVFTVSHSLERGLPLQIYCGHQLLEEHDDATNKRSSHLIPRLQHLFLLRKVMVPRIQK